eukprot:142468-Amphidinium_carterae.1
MEVILVAHAIISKHKQQSHGKYSLATSKNRVFCASVHQPRISAKAASECLKPSWCSEWLT